MVASFGALADQVQHAVVTQGLLVVLDAYSGSVGSSQRVDTKPVREGTVVHGEVCSTWGSSGAGHAWSLWRGSNVRWRRFRDDRDGAVRAVRRRPAAELGTE